MMKANFEFGIANVGVGYRKLDIFFVLFAIFVILIIYAECVVLE